MIGKWRKKVGAREVGKTCASCSTGRLIQEKKESWHKSLKESLKREEDLVSMMNSKALCSELGRNISCEEIRIFDISIMSFDLEEFFC